MGPGSRRNDAQCTQRAASRVSSGAVPLIGSSQMLFPRRQLLLSLFLRLASPTNSELFRMGAPK